MSQELSIRRMAQKAGITPMYLSLLERDACGPPSEDVLVKLGRAFEEQYAKKLFAKAGRIKPDIVTTILRDPQWSELIEAGKNLDGKQLEAIKEMILDPSLGSGSFLREVLSQVRERMSLQAKTRKTLKKRKSRERIAAV